MSFKRIGFFLLIVLSIATAVMLATDFRLTEPSAPPPSVEAPPAPAPAPVAPAPEPEKPAKPPVNLQSRAEALQAPAPLTEEDIQDDEQIEKEQVAAALAQLTSSDPAQRLEGAEQLGAYPTKEAETALQQVLATDSDADVRNAAAQSLGYLEKPTQATLNTLFSALEDQNEDVRLSALSTLEDFMLGADENSKRYKQILAGLQAKAGSRSVPQETRDAIRDIVTDQTAPPEAEPQ
jgi:hypothetical protein